MVLLFDLDFLCRFRDADVFPLLISVEVKLVFVAVVCKLIVHTVRQGRAGECLVVLERLARPDDKDIVLGNFLSGSSLDKDMCKSWRFRRL